MNIQREETGMLTATVRVKLGPEDYNPGLEKALKEQRKNAVLPGFRPGQVPMAIIKKRVGKALLVDEVERLLDQSLKDYLRDNGIRLLGQPMPTKEDATRNDWDTPGEFEFAYELGIAPVFDVELDRSIGVEYPVPEVTDDMVRQEVEGLQRRHGRLEDAATSGDKDMLLGDMVELDVTGSIKEGGILSRATISLQFLKDEDTRQSLTGKAVGDEVTVDPHKVSDGHDDLARMLGTDHERVHHLEGNFLFRIAEIKRMVPAELGPELFGRVYGEGEVADESALRERIRKDLEASFRMDADRLFTRFVMDKLCERAQVELPDGFLKRWIAETSEEASPEDVEQNWEANAGAIKRQLVEDRILERYGLEAKGEEIEGFAMQEAAGRFARLGLPEPTEDMVRDMALRTLGDPDRVRTVRDAIVRRKLAVHFRTLLEPVEKRMSLDEFINLAGAATA